MAVGTPLLPTALAFVSFGFVLIRVRVGGEDESNKILLRPENEF
jgi:hypothetical protein